VHAQAPSPPLCFLLISLSSHITFCDIVNPLAFQSNALQAQPWHDNSLVLRSNHYMDSESWCWIVKNWTRIDNVSRWYARKLVLIKPSLHTLYQAALCQKQFRKSIK
jgi:hypothetical protein